MSHFMNATMSDLRGGRNSWRVLLTLCAPSFAIAVAVTLLRFA